MKYGAVVGSMDVLVDVLRSHGHSNAGVAEECCLAIGWIMGGYVENRVKYGAVAGSMEVLVDVLRSHGRSNAEVAGCCCDAIGYITAGNAENKGKYGAVAASMEVLVDVLKAHGKTPASSIVLYFCCTAISELCESNASNASKLKSLNIIHVLEHEVTVNVDEKIDVLAIFRK